MNQQSQKIAIGLGVAALILLGLFASQYVTGRNSQNVAQPVQKSSLENATPSTVEKVYENTTYQYQVKYPQNWYVDSRNADVPLENLGNSESTDASGGSVVWSNYENGGSYTDGSSETPNDYQAVNLLVHNAGGATSLTEFVKSLDGVTENTDPEADTPPVFTVKGTFDQAGYAAMHREMKVEGSNIPSMQVLILVNDKVFDFTAAATEVSNAQLEKIVASFTPLK